MNLKRAELCRDYLNAIQIFTENFISGGTLQGSCTVLGEDHSYSFQRVTGTSPCLPWGAPRGRDSLAALGGCSWDSEQLKNLLIPGLFVLCKDGSLCSQQCPLAELLVLLPAPWGFAMQGGLQSHFSHPVLLRKNCTGGECVPADPKPEHFRQKIKKQRKKIEGESYSV